MATEAQRRATAKYDAANTVFYGIKLNRTTDADIISWLDRQESKQGAIKDACRAYMTHEYDTKP